MILFGTWRVRSEGDRGLLMTKRKIELKQRRPINYIYYMIYTGKHRPKILNRTTKIPSKYDLLQSHKVKNTGLL